MAVSVADIFKPFTDKLDALLSAIGAWYEELVRQVEDVLNLKEIVRDELGKVLQDFQDLVKDQADFADRLKHARTSVIRADKVIQLVNDIRTGELRQFVTDTLKGFHDAISPFSSEAADLFQSITTRGSGPLSVSSFGQKVFDVIRVIARVWRLIAQGIFVLRQIEPIVKELMDRLSDYESIIMKQTNPRHYVTSRHQTRIP